MVEGNEEAQRSELEQRLLAQLLQTRPDGISHEAELRVSFDRDPAWSTDIMSLGELVEVARTIRKLIAGARAIDGRDLSLPESPALSKIDASEFTQRVDRVGAFLAGGDLVRLNSVHLLVVRSVRGQLFMTQAHVDRT
jgi:hypothetical protein